MASHPANRISYPAAVNTAVAGRLRFLRVKTYSFLQVLNIFELGLFSGPESKALYEIVAIVVAFTIPAVLTILYGWSRLHIPDSGQ